MDQYNSEKIWEFNKAISLIAQLKSEGKKVDYIFALTIKVPSFIIYWFVFHFGCFGTIFYKIYEEI